MLSRILTIIVLNTAVGMPYMIQEHWLITTPDSAAYGEIVEETEGDTLEYCSVMCASNIKCNGVNLFASNNTCTLLHVEDVLDDWEKQHDDVTYICVDCEPGPVGKLPANTYKK